MDNKRKTNGEPTQNQWFAIAKAADGECKTIDG